MEKQFIVDDLNVGGEAWRLFKIMGEFVEGFDTLSSLDCPSVTIFGSARTPEDHPDYV